MENKKSNRRWTRKVAVGHISSWRRSGLSQSAYGRRVGVSGATISRWHRVLGRSAGPKGVSTGQGFARVVVSEPVGSAPKGRSVLEIVVGNGRSVRVSEGFDADTLRQVLRVVEC